MTFMSKSGKGEYVFEERKPSIAQIAAVPVLHPRPNPGHGAADSALPAWTSMPLDLGQKSSAAPVLTHSAEAGIANMCGEGCEGREEVDRIFASKAGAQNGVSIDLLTSPRSPSPRPARGSMPSPLASICGEASEDKEELVKTFASKVREHSCAVIYLLTPPRRPLTARAGDDGVANEGLKASSSSSGTKRDAEAAGAHDAEQAAKTSRRGIGASPVQGVTDQAQNAFDGEDQDFSPFSQMEEYE